MADNRTVSLYIADLKSTLEQWAKEEDRSISKIIQRLIKEEIKRREGQKDNDKE